MKGKEQGSMKGRERKRKTEKRFNFAPEFQCCYFCESSCLFYLSFNSDFSVSNIMHL